MKMKKLILYPKVSRIPQDYSKVKVETVPDQSLSLAEILKRFTRKEALPIEKEGHYETRFGDLEKLKHEDITVQHERVEEIKQSVKSHNARQDAEKAKREKEKEEKVKAAQAPPPCSS